MSQVLADIAKEAVGSLIGGAILTGFAYLFRGNIRRWLESIVEAGSKAKEKIEEQQKGDE